MAIKTWRRVNTCSDIYKAGGPGLTGLALLLNIFRYGKQESSIWKLSDTICIRGCSYYLYVVICRKIRRVGKI